jgi:hypothetical protein
MKGQSSTEFMLLLGGIIVAVVFIMAILYSKIGYLNTTLLNETSQYQIISSSFNINNSGIIYGKLQFSKYINLSTITITFKSKNVLFSVPFNSVGKNTTYGYILYLTENSTDSYSSYLYNTYSIKYMKYSNGNKNYFISTNYTGYFN